MDNRKIIVHCPLSIVHRPLSIVHYLNFQSMKFSKINILAVLFFFLVLSSCSKYEDLQLNPNVASDNKAIPPSLLLGKITYDIYRGGDVYEGPWDQLSRWNQYIVSNDVYYGGPNFYNWSTTGTEYNILKNVIKMEQQANTTLNTKTNAYSALGKFFRAYLSIWLSQRVGDIPMSQAGAGLENLTPSYDTQKQVYILSLQLLEDANTDLTALIPLNSSASVIDGDIFFGNDLKKWQKLINTYKLRVLLSLSKRADDNADMNIKQKFADVVSNPIKYPIMAANSDNMNFVFNAAYNPYPHTPKDAYNRAQNIGSTYLKLTTVAQDPRTFIVATPADSLLKGKKVSDFGAYAGADISTGLSDIATNNARGLYSFTNYNRYYGSLTGPEPYTIVGYSEMCFNIAEAANRGWVTTAKATDWYTKGINASLAFYNLTDGQTLTVADLAGKTLGTTVVDIKTFLSNTEVVYKGDNMDGLKQILNQKYVAMFQNSGWEAFYNQRRTGYPATFITTGTGVNGAGKIPRRWQYPSDESNYNTANYQTAVQSQFGGVDDIYKDLWIIK